MNTNSGDYGLLAHAFSFHWLTAVNQCYHMIIVYTAIMIVYIIFIFYLLSCRLTICLKAGTCAADLVIESISENR